MAIKIKLQQEIKQLIMDTVEANKEQIISRIVNQKRIMFDDNSHAWAPLLPQTIERKKRENDLFREPQSINIRKGGLFKAFANTGNYKVSRDQSSIDFNIELDQFEQYKTNTVASHERDVINVNQVELNQIKDILAQIISQAIQQKYGK
ncbi:MAG: hypothetical protein ACK5Z5_07575 [Neisseriaceae bacterium]|jgi:hypothetical protein